MAMLIYDAFLEERVRAELDAERPEGAYEVWEGDIVVSPLATNDHQDIASILMAACISAVDRAAGDRVQTCNVSDRHQGWARNYRNPDVAVYLHTNPAVNHGTHWQGGPDLAVEVLSPGEPPHAKLPFYSHVGTREVLLLFRDPWRLEFWRPSGAALTLAAAVAPGDPAVASVAVPLTFGLRPVGARPELVVTNPAAGQVWTA